MPIRLASRALLAVLLLWVVPGRAQDETRAQGEFESQDALESQDEIVLKDGSLVLGRVRSAESGSLVVRTSFAGDIRVQLDQIISLRSDTEISFLLDDGTYIENQPITVSAGRIVSAQEAVSNGTVPAISAIKTLNPAPWQLGYGYNWQGISSAALGMDRGNTQRDELDLDLDTQWRSTRDRYTLRGLYEVDRADGSRIKDLWRILGKYDIFLESTWYVGVNLRFESDKFADLNLRTYVGPYVGNQFYDSKKLRLSVETGLVYVSEDFATDAGNGSDNRALASNWSIDATSNYFGDAITLYFQQNGLAEFNTGDVLLSARTGVRFPLFGGLDGAAELAVDYDSGAAPGVNQLNQRYRFRIGYSW